MSWQLWLAVAIGLIAIDAFIINTAVVMWFGVGAAIVVLIKFIYPLSVAAQFIIFALFSPLALCLWKWYEKKNPRTTSSDSPNLNRKGAEYIGRVVELETDMTAGAGRVTIGDTSWLAHSDAKIDMPAGSQVSVADVRGTTIIVKKIENQS